MVQQAKQEIILINAGVGQAIAGLSTNRELGDWAQTHIYELARVCLPEYQVQFIKNLNPQEEEERKEHMTVREKIDVDLSQFSEILAGIRQQNALES